MLIFMKHTGFKARLYMTEARPPAAVAAIGITTAAACGLAGKRHGPGSFCASCHNNEMARHGRTVRNKANWPHRHMSGEDDQPTRSRGAIVRNEANLRRGRVARGLGDEERLCETKPISG